MLESLADTIQKKRIVCLFLAISIAFLSICLGTVQSDSAMMHEVVHHTDSVLKEVTSVTDSEQVYTETSQTLLSATTFFRQDSRRINNRMEREFSCLFLIVKLLSQIIPIIFAFCVTDSFPLTAGTNVIVRYIHAKDGKKNN